MTLKEKQLYHQVHPLKLATDISTSFITTWFLWEHDIMWFLILFLFPSVIVTWLLVRYADLEKIKDSRFGRYIAKYMKPWVVALRVTGQLLMWAFAWIHFFPGILVGFLIIVLAWCSGLVQNTPEKS